MISASHNPWQDNGIKIFGANGFKLPDGLELEIEREIFSRLETGDAHPADPKKSSLPGEHALARQYEEWLASTVKLDAGRLSVIVDCANGAAS